MHTDSKKDQEKYTIQHFFSLVKEKVLIITLIVAHLMTSFHLFSLVKEALLIINLIVTFLLTSFFSRSGAGGFSSRKSGFRTDRTDTEHEDNDHRPGNVGKSAYFSSASIPASCTKLLNMFRKITFLLTQLSNSSYSFTNSVPTNLRFS